MTSRIFAGTDEIIARSLGLPEREKLENISTCRKLTNARLPSSFTKDIVPLLFEYLRKNRNSDRVPSKENWRWVRQTKISEKNRRLEVVLEYAIATLGELGDLPEWYNQIPVASGMIDSHSDKRTAVDLARIEDNVGELVELKWESDTPLFAIFEVLRYGLALLFSRLNAEKFGYRGRPLIEVPALRLTVLAPHSYYDYGYGDCRKYADVIVAGLKQLRDTYPDLPETSFRFLRFPRSFEHPFKTGSEVRELCKGGQVSSRAKLREAMKSLEIVWEVN